MKRVTAVLLLCMSATVFAQERPAAGNNELALWASGGRGTT